MSVQQISDRNTWSNVAGEACPVLWEQTGHASNTITLNTVPFQIIYLSYMVAFSATTHCSTDSIVNLCLRRRSKLQLDILCFWFCEKCITMPIKHFPSRCCNPICGKPCPDQPPKSTISGKILNTATEEPMTELVTQVLCFMFSPSLSNVSHWGWDHQANYSSQKNGPIDSQRNNFSGGSI